MSPIRQVGIPLDHVAAELCAFPLASETALHESLPALDPMLRGATSTLWRAAERTVVAHFPGVSLDELIAIRDRYWFDDASTSVPLHRYLTMLARDVLVDQGHDAVPRLPVALCNVVTGHDSTLAVARRWWRWLTFAMPPDLLLAAIRAPASKSAKFACGLSGPERVNLIAPALQRQLNDRGFAEVHMHLGAALDFPSLWVQSQYAIADPRTRIEQFQSPGAELGEGRWLAPWLLRSALARYVLAAYLSWGRNEAGDFQSFLSASLPRRLRFLTTHSAWTTLIESLRELAIGHMNAPIESYSHLQGLYRELLADRATTPNRAVDYRQLMDRDPIATLVPRAASGNPSPEIRFVRCALSYLEARESAGNPDGGFTRLFWQVVRVRSLFYRHVTQRPLTPGLQWFLRFYGRIQPARGALSTELEWNLAADLQGRGRGLRSLEARFSPTFDASQGVRYFKEIDAVQRSWSAPSPAVPNVNTSRLELGVVLHFSKLRGGGAMQGRPTANWRGSNADPRCDDTNATNPSGYRYARLYNGHRETARRVASLIRQLPLALQFIRGLDLCTDELGVPNWVFVSVLDEIRAAGRDASGLLRATFGSEVPPLRTTVHVGEDFVHLLTGLRHVDEALDQLGLREGDRIGHGISLGVDPRDWARRAGRLAMTLENRLFDLAWEWHWYGTHGTIATAARMASIEREMDQLSERLFGTTTPPREVQQLREDLASPDQLRRVGFPDGLPNIRPDFSRFADGARLARLCRFLTDPDLFDRGKTVIWIDAAREGEPLAGLQAALRRKLGAQSIVVEINPTSNLLIGDLEDLTAHPMWRLRPPMTTGRRRRNASDAPPLGVCVGTDDLLTFASTLPQEYQCLADAMQLGQLSEDEAHRWLDQVRSCGLDHRFTIERVVPWPLTSFWNTAAD